MTLCKSGWCIAHSSSPTDDRKKTKQRRHCRYQTIRVSKWYNIAHFVIHRAVRNSFGAPKRAERRISREHSLQRGTLEHASRQGLLSPDFSRDRSVYEYKAACEAFAHVPFLRFFLHRWCPSTTLGQRVHAIMPQPWEMGLQVIRRGDERSVKTIISDKAKSGFETAFVTIRAILAFGRRHRYM